MPASVTTVDVLAAYGRQFHVVVPAQIGFSRGADGVVVRSDIKRINQLKGKTIATAQFTEVDFFIRYLAQEAGLPINALGSLDATPHPDRLNLVYTEDGFGAGDLFLSDLKSGKNRLAGCVTWEPKMSEVVEGSGGQAHVLTTNRNLLIIADVLIVHRGFAEQNSRRSSQGWCRGCSKATGWCASSPRRTSTSSAVRSSGRRDGREERAGECAPVEPAGEPRVLLRRDRRGRQLRRDLSVRGARLRQRSDQGPAGSRALRGPERAAGDRKVGLFKDQKIAIAPIRTGGGTSVEADPLLSKDIRFLFEPNSATLDHGEPGEPPQPRGDQAAAAGQPRVHAAAARPRRQRARWKSSGRWAARPTSGRRR